MHFNWDSARPIASQTAEEDANHVTAHQAAKLLGVCVGTVLNLVEQGQLKAWRTAGGHRRLDLAAIMDRVRQRSISMMTSVLVIEDEAFVRSLYREHFAAWALPIEYRETASGIEGLTEIGRSRPNILIIDLMMPGVDGFQVVRELRRNARFDGMDIIVITGLTGEKIAAAGGLPGNVVVWEKPIPFKQLRGFLDARLTPNRNGEPSTA